MIVFVPAGTEFFPKYIGWHITSTKKYALAAEETGVGRHMEALKPGAWNLPQSRNYDLWVWRPGIDFNQFGPVSP